MTCEITVPRRRGDRPIVDFAAGDGAKVPRRRGDRPSIRNWRDARAWFPRRRGDRPPEWFRVLAEALVPPQARG